MREQTREHIQIIPLHTFLQKYENGTKILWFWTINYENIRNVLIANRLFTRVIHVHDFQWVFQHFIVKYVYKLSTNSFHHHKS